MIPRCLCAWILLSAWGATSPAFDQRNVVLIMADDVAYDCFSCYGSDFFSTPRLDELAARIVDQKIHAAWAGGLIPQTHRAA